MNQFLLGVNHFFKAFGFIRKNNLQVYYAAPVLLSLVLFILAMYYGGPFSLAAAEWISKKMGLESIISPEWHSATNIILQWVIRLGIFMLALKSTKYVVLIILSPLFALLSEKTDEIISGKKYPFELGFFLTDIARGIAIAVRNACIEFFFIAVFFITGIFFPAVSLISAPVLFLLGSYFYGFSMLDYTCERRRLSISQSVAFMRRNKGLVLGNGIMFNVMDMIPFIGFVIGPVNAVVGATTAVLESESQKTLSR